MLPALLAFEVESTDDPDPIKAALGLLILALIVAVARSSRENARQKRAHYGRRGPIPESVARMMRVTGQTPKSLGREAPLVWREGRLVVMDASTQLPYRCVRCNLPTETRLKPKLRYLPTWTLALLLVPLVYLFAVPFLQQTARVEIGLCGRHLRNHRIWASLAALAMIAGFALLAVAAWTPPPLHDARDISSDLVVAGALTLLAAWFIRAYARPLSARYIDDRVIEMSGASDDFLDNLERRVD